MCTLHHLRSISMMHLSLDVRERSREIVLISSFVAFSITDDLSQSNDLSHDEKHTMLQTHFYPNPSSLCPHPLQQDTGGTREGPAALGYHRNKSNIVPLEVAATAGHLREIR